jgi:hypothetical protein
MQKQGIDQPLKVTIPCNSCGVSNKGCGVKDTYLKTQCPCATCLVMAMCKDICIERLCLTEKHHKYLSEEC